MLILPNKDTAFLQNNIFSIFYQKKYAFEHKTQKTGCKTYFFICFETKFSFSLQALTKQHNLFYTLKKLIPIYNAGLCEKSRVVFVKIKSFFCTLSKFCAGFSCMFNKNCYFCAGFL